MDRCHHGPRPSGGPRTRGQDKGQEEKRSMVDTGDPVRARWPLRTVPPDLAEHYRASGWWNDATLGSMVAEGLGSQGSAGFRVLSQVRPWSGTFSDIDRAARALAGALVVEGVGPGDVVVMQLPNWAEAGITFWAS